MRRLLWWGVFGGLVTRTVQRLKRVTDPPPPPPAGPSWKELSL